MLRFILGSWAADASAIDEAAFAEAPRSGGAGGCAGYRASFCSTVSTMEQIAVTAAHRCHFIPEEAPEALAAELSAFLAGLRSPRGT